MKIKFLGLILAGMVLVAGSAQAALLSVTGGDNTQTIDASFSLGAETGLALGAPLTAFNTANAGSGGLSLSGPGKLTFEFLGSEANFTNTFEVAGGQIFSNLSSLLGDTAELSLPGGLLEFALLTSGGGTPRAGVNGGPISAGVAFAFAAISDTSVVLLFDDGGFGDKDLDDFAVKISVSQVPLPAAVWLMLSALLGLVSFARIRRTGGTAA
jgi:hypothetical protein